ncbi:hypothetical protein BDP55DRAFT_674516 [Colletotrichum godetiae]|uniref:Uncharacterized protein n=1 Tax=Colletotrichum godetiae TaxID=1209918 RepID=A0AAJ0AGB0_9PEZI|nr:uncharacterized protein BDP55DRAFT_674516 [Colletotrichum godetiae]KAK1671923.1 hypothetical protein BDP55DRAFT_674516 [Colletotrichum godetiae]
MSSAQFQSWSLSLVMALSRPQSFATHPILSLAAAPFTLPPPPLCSATCTCTCTCVLPYHLPARLLIRLLPTTPKTLKAQVCSAARLRPVTSSLLLFLPSYF